MDLLVDTHCHLDFESYAGDLDEVLDRARDAGIKRIIAPGIDLASCRAVLKLAHKYAMVLAAVGVHPNHSAGWQDAWLDELRQLAEDSRVVAIGEIGLDYYRDHTPPEVQQQAFEAQITLAAELDLPVIVHNREADADVLRFLKRAGRGKGVLHSFSSSWEVATAALDQGFYLGFTGPITFKKADELRDVAARAPQDRILVETDGPFLAPHPYRGKRNEPAYVRYVARRLAEVKGLAAQDVAGATSANAARLFGDAVALAG
ncbi:MAG: TatD family hydrolase [Chloroflexota bacterium]|jgi:TatD DNase family protein